MAAPSRPAEAGADLFRPAPVLAVGIVADPDLPVGPDLVAAVTGVLDALAAECARIVDRDHDLFAAGPSRLRVLTRGPDEGARALAGAAKAGGAESAILSDADGPNLDGETGRLLLPGGQNAGERLNEALLAQADLVLAAWTGRAEAGPGSTGALVQEAVERRIPVLLLPPDRDGVVEVMDDPAAHLLPARAAELPRVRLADNLDRVLQRTFAPPAGREEREALLSFLAEPTAPRTFRREYRGLLLLASSRPSPPLAESTFSPAEEWERAVAVAALVSPDAAAAVARQALRSVRVEELAAFHAERVRSGVVLRYSGPAFGGLAIALLAVAAPDWSLAWLGVQAVVMTLTLAEASFATRGRWEARWLDTRSFAERIRCDRFLLPLGIGLGRLETETEAQDPAWMRWLHRRLLRAEPPVGTVADATVEAAFAHLRLVEIAGQIRYHRGAARRYRALARRLRQIATGSVVSIVVATLGLFGLAALPTEPAGVRATLMVLLITLPSVFLAARGLRLEGAFELAAARSEGALAALRRLRDLIPAVPHGYDRLVQASRAAAGAMIGDTVDWRIGLQRSRMPYRAAEE